MFTRKSEDGSGIINFLTIAPLIAGLGLALFMGIGMSNESKQYERQGNQLLQADTRPDIEIISADLESYIVTNTGEGIPESNGLSHYNSYRIKHEDILPNFPEIDNKASILAKNLGDGNFSVCISMDKPSKNIKYYNSTTGKTTSLEKCK